MPLLTWCLFKDPLEDYMAPMDVVISRSFLTFSNISSTWGPKRYSPLNRTLRRCCFISGFKHETQSQAFQRRIGITGCSISDIQSTPGVCVRDSFPLCNRLFTLLSIGLRKVLQDGLHFLPVIPVIRDSKPTELAILHRVGAPLILFSAASRCLLYLSGDGAGGTFPVSWTDIHFFAI